MPLTLDKIGRAMRDAIRDSVPILSYCQSLYNTTPTIAYGATGTKLTPEDFPAFSVVPWSKERGEEDEDRIFTFSVILVVTDTTEDEETTAGGVITKTYRGPKLVEDLLDLASDAVRTISTELFFTDKTTEINPVEYYPEIYGELVLTVSFPVLIGGFEPEL